MTPADLGASMTLTPSQSLLRALLISGDQKLFRATQEAFCEADKIPGCDGASKALFNALYKGGLCNGSTIDQRTGGNYHEAIQKLTAPEDQEGVDGLPAVGPLALADGASALREVIRERDRQLLIASCGKAISDLSSGAAPEGVSDEIRTALKSVKTQNGFPTLDSYVGGSISELRRTADRGVELTCGLGELDGLFSFRRANLVTVGARTSHGKTAFATRMVGRAVRAGLSVAYLCFEDYGSWLMKFATQYHQIPLSRFTEYHKNTPEQRAEAESALELCRQFDGLTVVPGMRLSEFSNVVDSLEKTPDLLVFDYVQKHVEMFGGDMKKNEAAARAASDFQELARKHNSFAIMTSQIARAPQEMRGKPPALEGLKESGDLENYSDAVILLHYPWRDSMDGKDLNREKYKVIVAKDKLGSGGQVECRFHGETLTLHNRYSTEAASG